jgi:hypothetical protein
MSLEQSKKGVLENIRLVLAAASTNKRIGENLQLGNFAEISAQPGTYPLGREEIMLLHQASQGALTPEQAVAQLAYLNNLIDH